MLKSNGLCMHNNTIQLAKLKVNRDCLNGALTNQVRVYNYKKLSMKQYAFTLFACLVYA